MTDLGTPFPLPHLTLGNRKITEERKAGRAFREQNKIKKIRHSHRFVAVVIQILIPFVEQNHPRSGSSTVIDKEGECKDAGIFVVWADKYSFFQKA